jgi:hypothetical protein
MLMKCTYLLEKTTRLVEPNPQIADVPYGREADGRRAMLGK